MSYHHSSQPHRQAAVGVSARPGLFTPAAPHQRRGPSYPTDREGEEQGSLSQKHRYVYIHEEEGLGG